MKSLTLKEIVEGSAIRESAVLPFCGDVIQRLSDFPGTASK